MAQTQWDRSNALFAETSSDGVFGENALKVHIAQQAKLFSSSTVFSKANASVEVDYYHSGGTPANSLLGVGLRLDPGNLYDGYWLLTRAGTGNQTVLYKQVGGSLQLINTFGTTAAVAGTRYKLLFQATGTDLSYSIIRFSDSVTVESGTFSDVTYSNAGVGGIQVTNQASMFTVFDNFKAQEI